MTGKRDLADEWFDRPPQPRQPEPVGMSEEQLRGIQKQIENLKERGSRGEDTYERLRELRARHYRETGAGGG